MARFMLNFHITCFRYHCLYNEIKDEHDPKEEYEFEEQAKIFIASYKAMQKKYQLLLVKQSQVRFDFFSPSNNMLFMKYFSNLHQHQS